MAQDEFDFNKFVDADNTVIKPSAQRVRNILTLYEKVAVIKAYEQQPMYKKVARMFNCSWEQIKNIIKNRAAIMEFYMAAKHKNNFETEIEVDDSHMDVKQKKIKFLGECVYECIQRLQYHAKLPVTEELIRLKALEFLDVMRIPGFSPTKKWLNLFKATYNITLSNKQVSIKSIPNSSLDLKDIVTYCTKQRPRKYERHEFKNPEHEAIRLRKLNFLQVAFKEYLLRVKFHHKAMKLDIMSLRKVAQDFNEILKVQDFEPTTEWIQSFRQQYESEECLVNVKRPPLSLDLKDILSYCSRMQNKSKEKTITLAPKETALQMRVLPKSDLKFKQSSIIYLEEDGASKDVKPDIDEICLEKPSLRQPPPLKIRKIESINNDPELRYKMPAKIEMRKAPVITIRSLPQEQPKPTVQTVIYTQKALAIRPTDNVNSARASQIRPEVNIKEETIDDNKYILPTNSTVLAQPAQQLRMQHDREELPRHVTSFKDALLLLKPLEEYAMLKENYRAIGLITQLEEVLKNEPESHSGDEEFIG